MIRPLTLVVKNENPRPAYKAKQLPSRTFVKVKIVSCSEEDKYKHLLGDHGMAYDEGDHYRIPRINLIVKKDDCELTSEIGRHF